ncbi:glycosyltransferase [Cytobacillus sp. Hz8]|uniref:glycosyltransferase n=1 Tax=Cytobacillus sp. Hz8 TaxID=3347168 RepID=UPI0035E1EB9B
MNIFYVSTVCSTRKFSQIYCESKLKPQQQAQKFHHLFIKGLASLKNSVYAMTVLPINRKSMNKMWIQREHEHQEEVDYDYLPILNFPILRHVLIFLIGFMTVLFWSHKKRNEPKVLICDVLNATTSISALLASKLFSVQSIAIITDLPGLMHNDDEKKKSGIKRWITYFYIKISYFFLHRYDGYVLLTEQMNERVNPKNKPFIIIEGMVDAGMKDVPNKVEDKYEEKIIIYAGALFEKYGVKKLIESFMKTNIREARLWIYGSGELEEEMEHYEKKDQRIRYFGVVPNEEVVKEEMKATLLVNPRPTEEEFTKYSFPSKNMEYMVSGTPVLTTKLPGMKSEYFDYLYLFENEDEVGIAQTLEEVLLQDQSNLFQIGENAKKFVLREKSNIEMAKKFMASLLG